MLRHIYHFNIHAEQRYFFGKHRQLYDIIALNGNIVSHTPRGVAGFINTTQKDYYIDPQTYAFQHDTIHLKKVVGDYRKFKPSIEKLALDHLKGPFEEVIRKDRPLNPEMFFENGTIQKSIIEEICKSTIHFQTRIMYDSLKDDDKEFIDEGERLPAFIIAPYFSLGVRDFREWMGLNTICYEMSNELIEDLPIYFNLVVKKDLFGMPDITKILEEFLNTMKPTGIILWLDDFYEEEMSYANLEKYISVLRALRNNSGDILISHGGYFSTLLGHSNFGSLIDGVGHSINYGEHRPVVPVGGGLPLAYFYLLPIHSRMKNAEALRILHSMDWLDSTESYTENVCRCPKCTEMLKQDENTENAFFETFCASSSKQFLRGNSFVSMEFPTSSAKQAAAYHYLYNKTKEFKDVLEIESMDLLSQLENIYNNISEKLGYDENVGHLLIWHSVLNKVF